MRRDSTSSVRRGMAVAVLAIIVLLVSSKTLCAQVQLASIFNDNMVLQRDRAVPIWGLAQSGEEITVTFAGQEKACITGPEGKWIVRLAPLEANDIPSLLTVKGSTTVMVKNVLVGEVWICGGQSNMGMTLSECFDAEKEIADAVDSKLRFVRVGSASSLYPMKDLQRRASWKICSPKTAAGFAGTAYFFGRKLVRELNVPIGLIEFDRGTTGIEGWVPLPAYKDTPGLTGIYREVSSWDPKTELGRKAHLDTFNKVKAWLPQAKDALKKGLPVPPLPRLPAPSPHRSDPCEIYNGTVHPLIPYAIRGAVWYQGESNPGEGKIYMQKMKAMIKGWRSAWGQGEFPFYMVQLANEGNPARYPAREDHFRYVPVREAQRRCLDLAHTGLVVAIDLGEDMNGHPRNKQDVGIRLALWALAKDYGNKLAYSGPLYRELRIVEDSAVLHFDYADSGLMIADKNRLDPVKEVKDAKMKYFALAGKDGVWHWAEATIQGKTVVVRSDKVASPVKVRYSYCLNPRGPKLYNRDGLPASPFCSDPALLQYDPKLP